MSDALKDLQDEQSNRDKQRVDGLVNDLRSLDPAKRTASIPSTDDAAAALSGTRQVSDDEYRSAVSTRESLMADPDWAKKLLAGDPQAKGEMMRVNSFISARSAP